MVGSPLAFHTLEEYLRTRTKDHSYVKLLLLRGNALETNAIILAWVFCLSTEWHSCRDLGLEFEIPFRDLGFSGVPHRQTSFIMPTVNCLVELIEMPFTVITLADVNVVNLERVGFGLRAFDMAIVPKVTNSYSLMPGENYLSLWLAALGHLPRGSLARRVGPTCQRLFQACSSTPS